MAISASEYEERGRCAVRWWNFPLGLFLFLVPFLSYMGTTLLWFCGVPLQRWIFPAGLLVSCLLLYLKRATLQLRKWDEYRLLAAFLILWGGGSFLSANIYDYAYDGMLYHQPMIYALTEGWNPVKETHAAMFSGEGYATYIDFYPKGMETMAAVFSAFFQNLEAGKVVNLLLLCSAFCFAHYFLSNYFSGRYSQIRITVLSVLLACSPVTVVQLFTFYVDWTLYYMILALAAILYDWAHSENPSRRLLDQWLVGMFVAVAVSIKITVMFWTVMFLVALSIFWTMVSGNCFRKMFSLAVHAFAGVCVGFLLLAFNPYVTNVAEGRNMFHPFLGTAAVDVDAIQSEALDGDFRTKSVLKSLTSRPYSGATYQGPMALNAESCINSGKADTRLGGFGVLYLEILLLSTVLFICSYQHRQRYWKWCAAGLVLLFLFLLLLPNGWWARFTPFFYLFPWVCLLYTLKYGGRRVRTSSLLAVALLSLNIGIVMSAAAGLMLIHRSKVHYLLEVLENTGQPVRINSHNFAFNYKLQEHGIIVEPCDTLSDILVYPGSPVAIDRDEWREDLVDKNQYFLLKYSNIKEQIADRQPTRQSREVSICCDSR